LKHLETKLTNPILVKNLDLDRFIEHKTSLHDKETTFNMLSSMRGQRVRSICSVWGYLGRALDKSSALSGLRVFLWWASME
jgi:hypothetical protein